MATAGLEHIGHGAWRYTLGAGAKAIDTEESLFLERDQIKKGLEIYLKELANTAQLKHIGPMVAPIIQVHSPVPLSVTALRPTV